MSGDRTQRGRPRPRPRPRPAVSKGDEFADAWAALTEDRSTYNLGDGCRRVPARGSSE